MICLVLSNTKSRKMENHASSTVLPDWPETNSLDVPVEIYHNPIPVPMPIHPEEPTSLIISLASTLKMLKKGKDIILPIKKILNIGAEVNIYKLSKQLYRVNIEPTDFQVEDNILFEDTYNRELSKEITEDAFLQNMVRRLLLNLKTIKINKINGRFCINHICHHVMDELWTMFCDEFKEVDTLTLALDECCVCYTFTKTITNCKHSLCLDCVSKIKDETSNDDDTNIHEDYKNCPMCRQRITHLYHK